MHARVVGHYRARLRGKINLAYSRLHLKHTACMCQRLHCIRSTLFLPLLEYKLYTRSRPTLYQLFYPSSNSCELLFSCNVGSEYSLAFTDRFVSLVVCQNTVCVCVSVAGFVSLSISLLVCVCGSVAGFVSLSVSLLVCVSVAGFVS